MRLFFLTLFLSFALPAGAVSESQIAKLVEKAPIVKSSADLKNLTHFFKTSFNSDKEKAYAALVWITKNIDYDDYKYRQIEKNRLSRRSRAEIPKLGDILKTRVGVCGDIAELYKDILDDLDIPTKVVTGCVEVIEKGKKKQCAEKSPSHAWNAVWIGDQWELVDPTWAIGGDKTTAMDTVSRQWQYNAQSRKRQRSSSKIYQPRQNREVKEQWFMVPPEKMQEDHLPFNEKWTLIKTRDRKNKNL